MTSARMIKTALMGTTALLAVTSAGHAQTSGAAGLSSFQGGYGNARYSTSSNTTGSTRDENGNRLIVDGIMQSGASSYSSSNTGASSSYSGAGSSSSGGTVIGGATAIGNNLNVVVQGNHNTVIVNSRQTNNGNITAGTVLNGTLNLGN